MNRDKIIFSVLMALLVMTFSGCVIGGEPVSNISAEISVKDNQADGVLLSLRIANKGRADYWINPVNLCSSGIIESDLFEIYADNEKTRLPYKGVMTGGQNGSFVLKSGRAYECSVRLDVNYQFKSGEHNYKVKYSAFNPEQKGNQKAEWLISNEIAFIFPR